MNNFIKISLFIVGGFFLSSCGSEQIAEKKSVSYIKEKYGCIKNLEILGSSCKKAVGCTVEAFVERYFYVGLTSTCDKQKIPAKLRFILNITSDGKHVINVEVIQI